ncbi:hypothetical protein ACE01N_06035 [Saccharicrinis sp. FJH2]|uniref:hypothetical protein n=1 Tax=Saccharicrinis sp. FJH65 TaxID=3344659 RepID=UPI0035F4B71F
MKGIGGYFEFDCYHNTDLHKNALFLNSGRSCLRYIIKAYQIKKLFIPLFSCDVILDIIIEEKIEFSFYKIDENFEPVLNNLLECDDWLLYINYFGLKSDYLEKLALVHKNSIVDNSQALFTPPVGEFPTFYSPRKFTGLPDGGLLYCNRKIDSFLEKDTSIKGTEHLFLRLEESPEMGFNSFLENERNINVAGFKKISDLSKSIYSNTNFSYIKEMRNKNYSYLNDKLSSLNRLSNIFDISDIKVPLAYPFLNSEIDGEKLRYHLIKNRVFVPQYWPNVLNWASKSDTEYYITKNIVYLPIDQRYTFKDMDIILNMVLEWKK